MSTAREAILQAAAHIEQHPESYDFLVTEVPTKESRQRACVLGWIGHFLGIAPGENVARVATALGHGSEYAIYSQMDEFDWDSRRIDLHWQRKPAIAARQMRQIATKYY